MNHFYSNLKLFFVVLFGFVSVSSSAETVCVQSFTLHCKRGYVAGNGTKLRGALFSFSASTFAIVPFNEDTYLYDVTNKKFVCHTTDAQAGETGNVALESNTDLATVVKGVKFGDTGFKDYPYYLEDCWGNWLNMDGDRDVYMNTWKDFEDGKGGNTYAITVVDENYDATEAIELLASMASVDIIVSDTEENEVARLSSKLKIGTILAAVPETLKRAYCSYDFEPLEVVAGENVFHIIVTYNLPFHTSTNYADATWYYAKIRGSKYLRADENAKDDSGRYKTSNTNEKSAVYKWAFFGNPYTNFYIANKGAGEGKYLCADAAPTMQETDAPSTTEAFLFALTENGDGFTLRSITSADLYLNDAGRNGVLGYWNSSRGATDQGSRWNVDAVPATDLEVTYNVILDDQVVASTVAVAQAGDAAAAPASLQNDFIATLVPDTEILTEETSVVNLTATLAEIPFEISASYEDAKWYYLHGHAKYADRYVSTDGEATVWDAGNDETDAYMWAFMGTPYGIKLINKAAGSDAYVQGTNPATLGPESQAWVLKKQSTTTWSCGETGFGLWATSLKYLNTQGGTLKYWGDFDQGSTFWVEDIPEMYPIVISDDIQHGTVDAGREQAVAGRTIVLTITPDDGYLLSELSVKQGDEDIVVTENTFVMPAAEVLISATFVVDPALLATLEAEIDAAEAMKTDARTEGVDVFNAAIAAAQEAMTATDVEIILAATDALLLAEKAFLTANLPIAEGMYYVYHPMSGRFLSRGNVWGTAAVVDAYGVAINVTVANLNDGQYTLSGFDNNLPYGFDDWMYSDCSGDNADKARVYTLSKVEGGFTLTNTNNGLPVYVFMNDAEPENVYRVAGNGTKDENYTDDAQTVWQFVTPAERDEMVAAREAAETTAAFTAAGLATDALIDVAEATELTFATGSAWTQTVVRTEKNQPATNVNGTEMWQATGYYTQTVADLEPGLYKLSIQGFYRDGNADEGMARYATGYNSVLAYLEANGNMIQMKSWAADKGEGNDPNSMSQAKAMFDEGKYLAEGFAYVGEDGILHLTVNNPGFIGNGWFMVNNVKYAKVTLAPDGIKDFNEDKYVGTIYDLSGRKVEKMVKGGIYIVNGKKASMK